MENIHDGRTDRERKDGDSSLSTTISVESKYKKGRNNLLLKAGINTSQSRDNGEPLEIETQKGLAEVRYDYNMPSGIGLFALTDYNYDGKNDSGVNSLLSGIGLAKPVIQNKTTELVVAIGPSMQWTNGGDECGKDPYCGNAYAGEHLQLTCHGNQASCLNWCSKQVVGSIHS